MNHTRGRFDEGRPEKSFLGWVFVGASPASKDRPGSRVFLEEAGHSAAGAGWDTVVVDKTV